MSNEGARRASIFKRLQKKGRWSQFVGIFLNYLTCCNAKFYDRFTNVPTLYEPFSLGLKLKIRFNFAVKRSATELKDFCTTEYAPL